VAAPLCFAVVFAFLIFLIALLDCRLGVIGDGRWTEVVCVMRSAMAHGYIVFYRVLSAYEESSAACISDMLRQVSNGQYLEAIRMAEKFILHVEVLFATIDDLEYKFARLQLKGGLFNIWTGLQDMLLKPLSTRHVTCTRSKDALQEDGRPLHASFAYE
jgi:hypothetical protein